MGFLEIMAMLNGVWISTIIGILWVRRERRREERKKKIEAQWQTQWKSNYRVRVE
ncbi:hypothetical protein GPJ61_27760 [Brevibacillus formosus]|uniref:hypothetical protein n=1 Tax=Brevibacillus formosus TaxID=54913 RepID=UPI001CA5ADE9|nr:hypothetical protein [Brevibacillus formosus]MBW5471587.1 hypothetical protein [Brevibacillus formosus]